MKYSVGTIAKAFMAFVTAFGGAAATSVPHDALGWVGCVGAGLVAFAAVFATPNKSDQPAPADAAITAIQATVAQAQSAVSEVERIKNAASDALNTVPVVGPLASAVINSVKLS